MPDHEVLNARSDTATGHVATYRRVLPVSLERMYENTLDWEHLPHVHSDSFSSIKCLEAGSWGWRAEVADARGERSVIELTLDRSVRRWITRNLEGPNKGAEIWTHVFPVEPQRLEIVVDFFVPGVSAEARDKVGAAYAGLYSRLYDEDVAMMVERQRALDTRIEAGARTVELGPRAQLKLPMQVTLVSREFVITAVDDELVGFPRFCPHQLGPLDASSLEAGNVTCPWHGYRFDVRSGECVSGQNCRMQSLVFAGHDGNITVSTTH
jgi:nitrite reductase/ring-hydroxylating ferredoxin subunit